MYTRPAQWIWLGLPQHFAGHRGRIPFAQGEELQKVRDWIPLGPSEVRMRDLPGEVADVEKQGRDRIRDRRTHAAQDTVAIDGNAGDLQLIAELRHVARPYFQEQN